MELHKRIIKIIKILKYNEIITQIMEVIEFHAIIFETHKNYRIALENYVNQ